VAIYDDFRLVDLKRVGWSLFPPAYAELVWSCQEFLPIPVTDSWGGVVMPAVLRQATIADIAAMHRVRLSVHENRLVFSVISEGDLGFAIANATDGNVWALFVHPDHQRRGYGRQLHDVMVSWLWEQDVPKLWLMTDPDTRAERFYESAGWVPGGTCKQRAASLRACDPS
jgi:GNAT superfamily N-acetyltransferase